MLDIAAHFRLSADPFAPSARETTSASEFLTEAESAAFIDERLVRAGAPRDLFSPQARAALWQASGGVPHRLRWLAGLAMVEAMLSNERTIEVGHVHAAADLAAIGQPPPPPAHPTKKRRRFALPVPSTGQAAAILALPVVLLTAPIVVDMFTVPTMPPTRPAIERTPPEARNRPEPRTVAEAETVPTDDFGDLDDATVVDAVEPAGEPYVADASDYPRELTPPVVREDFDVEPARGERPAPTSRAPRPAREPDRRADAERAAPETPLRVIVERAESPAPRLAPSAEGVRRASRIPEQDLSPPEPTEPEGATATRLTEGDPSTPVRVFIHHAPRDRQAAAELGAALSARGWPIIELRAVGTAVSRVNTRYFFREDADPAFALAEDLSSLTGTRIQTRDMRSYSRPPRAGTIEVWLPPRG